MVKSFVSTEARILQQPHSSSSYFSKLFPKKFFLLNHLHYITRQQWFLIAQKLHACTNSKTPDRFHDRGFWYRCLTMTYSHMGKPHTTIGDASFHYWVRDGIRWFQCSMVVKRFSWDVALALSRIGYVMSWFVVVQIFGCCSLHRDTQTSNCLGVIWSSLTGN